MPQGTRDWELDTSVNPTVRLSDLGEHAVRTGSVVSFDRRGDVLWFDDFENGHHMWEESLIGIGAARAISTDEARNGAQSELLTGGSTSSRLAAIFHRQAKPAGNRFGIEFSFALPGIISTLVMRLIIFDGTNSTEFTVQWIDSDQELNFLNSSSIFENFATSVDFTILETLFNTFKLVGDVSTNRYVRFLVNDTEYDLSANAGNQDTDTSSPHIAFQIELTSRASQNDTLHVDDAILTQNEP